jgi:DUF1680 family protein
MTELSRRHLLAAAWPAVVVANRARAAALSCILAEPFPLEAVRLGPSHFLSAMEANRTYLFQLEPDRFLHNFRAQAGLAPKGPVYGGWEAESIAGHSLGHYLSALSLLHAQTGDAAACERVGYIVSELALCQAASPDGYVGGLTRKQDGRSEPGRAVFEDLRQGRIHSTGFALNGAWSPLYTVHKLFAGLLDAERYCRNAASRPVALRLAAYVDGVFARLDDAQMQAVLACEYGGLNESFAELYARTGDTRWLKLARRVYDRKTLDPLAGGRDELANLHANTQIPKVIGLARLHELTGEPRYAVASDTFWTAVTRHHSYAIGGHGDREYFQAPDAIASHITEQTCESCNSYNMLKLTRLLYARAPQANYFDFYERTHLNHILAQQNPRTGMFCYMTPLMSGEARAYSSPFDDFWCCVGTGMESHAKHGESIYWHQGRDTLIVNLFIPSTLTWAADGSRFELSTSYPLSGQVELRVAARRSGTMLTIALRKPGWAKSAALRLNGRAVAAQAGADGYMRVRHAWRTGDRLTLDLPLDLRAEATPDDPHMVALFRGPLVLAADLGPAQAGTPYDGPVPALIADTPVQAVEMTAVPAVYRTMSAREAGGYALSPFAAQHERRTAVYFPAYTAAQWALRRTADEAKVNAVRALAARTVDQVRLGEMQSERDHDLKADISYPVVYRGRNGRDARAGGYFEFALKVRPGAHVLRATYWGEERNRAFSILVDGRKLARQELEGRQPGAFIDRDYAIPDSWIEGQVRMTVRFVPDPDRTAGPVFGVALLKET